MKYVLIGLGIMGMASGTLLAADFTWLGSPASGNWNEADTNWTGAASVWTSAPTNSAIFGTSGTQTIAAGAVTLSNLTFNADGYAISGGPLSPFGNFSVATNVTAWLTVPIVHSATNLVLNKYGTGTVVLNPGSGSGSNVFASLKVVQGTAHVAGGTNVITLMNGQPESNPAFWVSGGTLVVGGGLLKSTGNMYGRVGEYGTLLITNGYVDLSSYSELLNGHNSPGVTTVSGTGVLEVKGLRVSQNTYAANLTVVNINTGGTIRLNAFGLDAGSVRNGTVNFNGGTVVARDSSVSFDFLGTTSTNWRNIAVNVLPGGAIVDNNTYSFTMRQNMAGSAGDGGFTKLNSGYLYMRGTNTFTGGFRIKGGAVNIIRDHNLGAAPSSPSTNVWFLADATLQSSDTHALDANRTLFVSTNVTVTLDTQSYTQTVNGVITGLGKSWLTKSGTGLLAINPGANRTNSVSTFRVAAGTVQVLSGTTDVTTNDFSTTNIGLDINGGNMIISGGKIRTTGIGYCAVNGSLLVTNGTVDCGTSREMLNAFNGHGTTTVAGNGVLNVNQFRISQCSTAPASANAINVNTGGIVRVSNFYIDTTYSRPWGYLNLNGGTLVANVSRTDFLGTGQSQWLTNVFVYVLEGGAILDTEDKSIGIQQSLYSAALADGGLTKRGNGTLTLLNTNTYNGATSVEGGTLKLGVATNTLFTGGSAFVSSNAVFDVNGKVQTLAALGGSGTVTNNGSLTVVGLIAPGGTNGIGTLTLASACSLSGELRVDVATNGVCDRLYVQGDLSVTNLALTVADTGLLNENRRYVIANCSGAVSGPFASAALPRRWFVQYDAANRRVYLIYNRGTVLTLR